MQKQTFQIGKNFIPGVLFSACSAVLLLFGALMIASPTATLTNATDEPDYADGLSLITNQTIEATIRPEETGSLSIIKDTVIGATNSQYGYEVYISTNSDTVNDIYLDGNPDNNETTQVISATSGTYAAPAVLDITNGATWGYAVAGLDNFDASYNEASPATTAKFAAVPTSDGKQLVHRNTSAAADDNFDVYYGINADSTLEPGLYKTEIVYTAVPIIPPLTAKAILGLNRNLNFVYDRNTYAYGEEYTDNLGTTRIVGVFPVPTDSSYSNKPFWTADSSLQSYILSANFDSSFYDFEPTSTAFWFNYDTELTSITNTEYLNTSSVTDMSYMFSNAGYNAATWNISDISSWNVSNVTDMSNMFEFAGYNATTWNIGDLGYIDATHPGWNVGSVTNMSKMFSGAGGKATTWSIGDISSWNVSNVTDMSFMLSYAGEKSTTWNIGNLGYVDATHPGWDVSSVTNMSCTFQGAGYHATTWNTIDISSWNVSNVINMSKMFEGAGYDATTWSIGDISSWNVSSVTDMSEMFRNAGQNATTWNIGNLGYVDANHPGWDVSSVTNMSYMFTSAGDNATTWNIGDISGWNVSSVTNHSNFINTNANSTNLSVVNNQPSWQ